MWLFQPKESALVLFRDNARAGAAVSFGGAYLAAPSVGVLGSPGAMAIPLLATLLAWGREGQAARIERCMDLAEAFAHFVRSEQHLELRTEPQNGVVVWRPRDDQTLRTVQESLPGGAASTTTLDGERWFRNVAANPNADVNLLVSQVSSAMAGRPA